MLVLLVLFVLLVIAVWLAHGPAIGMLWRTRGMTPEEAARHLLAEVQSPDLPEHPEKGT